MSKRVDEGVEIMKTHKDLDVWKRGLDLVEQIYTITQKFPKEEIYGLTSQLRRASVSFPSNIAEGAARSSIKEYIQFLYISVGSLSELETQVIIADKLGYFSGDEILEDVESLRKMTLSFIKYLKSKK